MVDLGGPRLARDRHVVTGERPAGACGHHFSHRGAEKHGIGRTQPPHGVRRGVLSAIDERGVAGHDADAIRSDIREGRPGTPLVLALRVRAGDDCAPVENAIVDIWHCDAGGVYSGFDSGEGERFLRGAQATNEDGIAKFTTIYPGFYQGRTVHIHAKVHLDRQTVLTTQLYFDDAVSDKVFAEDPYAAQGERDQRNDSDGIFDDSLLLTLERSGEGYLGLMNFDVARA